VAEQSLAPAPAPAVGGHPLRVMGLVVVLLATVLDLLDSLVTTIAGPTIMRDLDGSATLLEWLTGYTIAMAAGILVGGRLGDIYGRRRCLLVGMAGFTLLSVACALCRDPTQLVACRVAQGLLGALMVPQGFGLVKEMFPPAAAAKALGAMGPAIAISTVCGPILAGWLIDRDLFGIGWRMIFLINLPLGLIGFLLGAYALPIGQRHQSLTLDVPGSLVAAAAMGVLIYPMIEGREKGWPWWTYLMLASALLMFAVFVVLERRRDRAGRATLLTPSLFAKRAFVAGLASGLTLFAALIGLSIALTVFTQLGLGFSPLKAGLAGLPQALGMILGFGLAQGLATRFRTRSIMQTGTGLVMLGLAGFIVTIGAREDHVTILSMAPALLVIGAGNGLALAPFFDLVLSQVDYHELGSASGALTAAQQIGASAGIAILGTIVFTLLGNLNLLTPDAYTHATQVAVGAGAGLALLAAIASTQLPPRSRAHEPIATAEH